MAERISEYKENMGIQVKEVEDTLQMLTSISIYRKGWQNLYDELLASEKSGIEEDVVDLKYWKKRLGRVLRTLANCGVIKPSDEDNDSSLL